MASIDFIQSYPIIKWDISKHTLFKHYNGSLDDSANGYRVQIFQDNNIVVPSADNEVYFYFEKKDNTHGYLKGEPLGNYFLVNLTNQVFSYVGNVSCNLQITDKVKWKTSPEFFINVDKNNIRDSIESSNDFIAFQNALNSLVSTVEQAETAIANINAATANAITATTNTINATNVMNTLNTNVTNAENVRVTNENNRIDKEIARPDWEKKTQEEFRAIEIKDSHTFYQITDNDGEYPTALETLINGVAQAKTNYESAVVIDTNLEVLDARDGKTDLKTKINSRGKMYTYKYTSTGGESTVQHGLDYVSTTDNMIITWDGFELIEGTNFSFNISARTILLIGWTLTSGEILNFRLFKNIV